MKLLILFAIFLFLIFISSFYIFFLPKPIDEESCEVIEVSPDKVYKVIVCDASYKIFPTQDMYSLKIYNERTGKLMYKDVFYFIDGSKFWWECQNKVCKSFIYLGDGGGVTVSLPPNYLHRLRAKIPLWGGEW
ncbi:MAG: hypothetical protein JSR33_11555 [Proteobacteria bacterium]|nr:hypothetical protein [Pseudomonadota bacterium]